MYVILLYLFLEKKENGYLIYWAEKKEIKMIII